jgi:hypothetical protein
LKNDFDPQTLNMPPQGFSSALVAAGGRARFIRDICGLFS